MPRTLLRDSLLAAFDVANSGMRLTKTDLMPIISTLSQNQISSRTMFSATGTVGDMVHLMLKNLAGP